MRRPLLLFAVACCAFAAACSGTASTGQGSNASDRQSDAPSGTEAATLEFTVPAVDGTTFRGADYAGDALAIWFWAPW